MIHTFENSALRHSFNQKFKYSIFEKNYKTKLQLPRLTSFILKNEKNIMEKTKKELSRFIKESPGWVDGNTGLGLKSLTSRSPLYNLVEFKEMKYLKKIIHDAHDEFLKELNIDDRDQLYIKCWANVMRKGEKIKTHFHALSNYDYLSGHICVSTKDTHTYYLQPYYKNVFSSKNVPGKLTLFPSWIEHYTDEVKTNKERITIAFDLRGEESYQEDIYPHMKHHWENI